MTGDRVSNPGTIDALDALARGDVDSARVHATLASVEALEVIGAELYRIRVAVEVIAGDVLDRAAAVELGDPPSLPTPAAARINPAGAELRHIGRLDVLLDPDKSERRSDDER